MYNFLDMNIKEIVFKKLRSLTTKEFDENSNISEIGIDSLDLVELVVEAEDKFKVSISDEELVKFKTIGDLIKEIKNKQKN